MTASSVKDALVTAVDTLAKIGSKVTPGKPEPLRPKPKPSKPAR